MKLPDVVREMLDEGLGGDVGTVHVQVRELNEEVLAELVTRGIEESLGQCVIELREGWVVIPVILNVRTRRERWCRRYSRPSICGHEDNHVVFVVSWGQPDGRWVGCWIVDLEVVR